MKNNIEKIRSILKAEPPVLFSYLFGSRSKEESTVRSDWDIAVYFSQYPVEDDPWIRFKIQVKLSTALKTDAVDIVIMNNLQEPSFAFDILNNSIILVDKNPTARIIYEARALNRYFDWQYFLKRHILSSS
jgi:predicted nucleotidyltransferase